MFDLTHGCMMIYHAYLGTLLARRRLDSGLVEAAATAPCVNVDDSAAHQYYIGNITCGGHKKAHLGLEGCHK